MMHIIHVPFQQQSPHNMDPLSSTAAGRPAAGLARLLTSSVALLYLLVCGLLLAAQLCRFFCINRRAVYARVVRGVVKFW